MGSLEQGDSIPAEIDVIVVGGGTAGSVIVGRLGKADPSLRILIIESGKDNFNDETLSTPGFFTQSFAPGNKNIEFYVDSKPSKYLDGRQTIVPVGHVLGGGTSVNVMQYTRASASEYDDWNTEGWRFKDLKPLFKKCETYHVEAGQDTHGYDGPMHVSNTGSTHKLADQYIEAAKSHFGMEYVNDIMDFETAGNDKIGKLPKWINPIDGTRSDAATAFLQPLRSTHHNLHILFKTKVSRIIFEGTKAVGVEVVANKIFDDAVDQTPRKFYARKLVVISAGALATPQILQRSGIGAAAKLQTLGVQNIVSDLPGVGMNLRDHPYIRGGITLVEAESVDTGDDLALADPQTVAMLHDRFKKQKGGYLSWNFCETGIKHRPSEKEVKALGPDFENWWKNDFVGKPGKALIALLTFMIHGNIVGYPKGRYMSMVFCLLHSRSTGHVHIVSANDIYAPPDFDDGLLSDPLDVPPQRWAYKRGREIQRRMPAYRGEWAQSHPVFPEGSNAAVTPYEPQQSSGDLKDYVYTAEDDAAIDEWIRKGTLSMCHPMGTCAMKPRQEGGVVDKDLNVYGTSHLKIADMSITPAMVGANTASTALVIGEKAAMIIAQELGIKM